MQQVKGNLRGNQKIKKREEQNDTFWKKSSKIPYSDSGGKRFAFDTFSDRITADKDQLRYTFVSARGYRDDAGTGNFTG